jgi:hypothetical protein
MCMLRLCVGRELDYNVCLKKKLRGRGYDLGLLAILIVRHPRFDSLSFLIQPSYDAAWIYSGNKLTHSVCTMIDRDKGKICRPK